VLRHDLYIIEIDYGRNYYSCRGFGYLARNYRNQRIVRRERRLEYENNTNTRNNLNGKEILVVLD